MIKIQRMSDTEREIMEIIWDSKIPIIASEVLTMADKNREWSYSTVATFLLRICQKGILRAEKKGNTNLYYPVITKDEYLVVETENFIKGVHNGSIKSFMAALCKNESNLNLTAKQIDELKKVIENL